jgi:hypothetical protein
MKNPSVPLQNSNEIVKLYLKIGLPVLPAEYKTPQTKQKAISTTHK